VVWQPCIRLPRWPSVGCRLLDFASGAGSGAELPFATAADDPPAMLRLVLAMTLIAVLPLGAALRSAEMSGRFAVATTLGLGDQHNPGFPVGWEGYPAETISLDVALEGTDKAWSDDLQLLIGG
jgi:hypothetical protein